MMAIAILTTEVTTILVSYGVSDDGGGANGGGIGGDYVDGGRHVSVGYD